MTSYAQKKKTNSKNCTVHSQTKKEKKRHPPPWMCCTGGTDKRLIYIVDEAGEQKKNVHLHCATANIFICAPRFTHAVLVHRSVTQDTSSFVHRGARTRFLCTEHMEALCDAAANVVLCDGRSQADCEAPDANMPHHSQLCPSEPHLKTR